MNDSDNDKNDPGTVLVTGAAGFVGRNAARALVEAGVRVRAFIRPAHDPEPLKELGCEIVTGDLIDETVLSGACADIGTVVHCVGIIRERPKEGVTFEAIHDTATKNLAVAARAAGAKRFVLVSSLGTRPKAPSRYHRTKFAGEEAVKQVFPDGTVILRPSVIIGPGDAFTPLLVDLIEKAPLAVPVIGQGSNRMQPIHVNDLTGCITAAVLRDDVKPGVYELGGPEVIEFLALIHLLMDIRGRNRIKFHVPIWLMFLVVPVMQWLLKNPPITLEELRLIREDNICPSDEENRPCNDAPRLLRRRLIGLEETLRANLAT